MTVRLTPAGVLLVIIAAYLLATELLAPDHAPLGLVAMQGR